jgi:photosystem II stability/assembly factor-like uncharacterized protein
MKTLFILFIVFNTIILRSQNFISLNNEITNNLSVYSIAVSETNIFIGTNDGVYLSENNSNNWIAVNKGIELNDIYSLYISDSTIYAGTYYGVFSSTNNGQSWSNLTLGLSDPIVVYDVVVNNSVILAACNYGMYRSADNGKSWTKIPLFSNFEVECLVIKKSGLNTYIFAGTDIMGIFMSSNNGTTWKPVNDGQVLLGDEFISSIFIKDDGTIFAGDGYGFLYRSTDNGDSWDFIDDNGDVSGYVNGFTYNNTTNELFVGINDNNLFKSIDNGASWVSCSDNILTMDKSVTSLLINNEFLYVGTNNFGIFSSKMPINPLLTSIISLSGELDFGEIEIGNIDSTDLVISNKGNKDIIVNSITFPTGFSCNWTGTIKQHENITLKVYFIPLEEYIYKGKIQVFSNSDFGIDTISVNGTGYKKGAVILLSGDLDFGDVEIGNPITKTLIILNSGKDDLRIDSISCPNDFSGSFTGIIPVKQTKPILIIFNPNEVKTYAGDIIVYSNARIGTSTIAVTGVSYQMGSTISLSGNLDFGEIEVGKSSSSDLNISNDGNVPLKIDSISLPAGFSGNWSGTISPNQNISITLKFSPIEDKLYTGNLTVYSNAQSGINTIKVKGSGITTSVIDHEIFTYNNISILPNPSTDFIHIYISNSKKSLGLINIQIYDILGINVFPAIRETKFSEIIDITNLLPGVYYIIVGNITQKFVKI